METTADMPRVKVLTDDLKKKFKYGIKAYGTWELFKGKTKYRKYLKEWIAGTDGSEQERATSAYFALDDGENYFNSDMI